MATETEFRTTLEHTIEKYRQVLERFPYESSAQLALAELTQLRGLRLEALLSHQEILKVTPVPESRVALADVYASQGLYNQAFEELTATLAEHPIFPEAHYCASEFSETVPLPDELKLALEKPCHQSDLARAFLQVGLKRSVVLRELQELSQVSDRSKGEPLAVYRVEETRKRLLLLERRLVRIEHLETLRVEREAEAERLKLLELERLRQLHELQKATPVELTTEPSNGTTSTWEDVSTEVRNPHPAVVPEQEQSENILPVEAANPVQEMVHHPEIEIALDVEEVVSPVHTESREDGVEESNLTDLVPVLEPTLPPLEGGGLGDDLLGATFQSEAHYQDPLSQSWSPSQAVSAHPLDSAETLHHDVGDLSGDDHELSIDLHFSDLEEPTVDEQLEILRSSESRDSGEGHVAAVSASAEAPAPVEPPVVVVAAPPPAPSVPDSAPVPNRSEIYRKIQGEVSGLIAILAKTRGVTSIHVVARDGFLVDQSSRDAMPVDRVSEFIVEGLGILEGFAEEPKYWVLECSGGIVVFQIIDPRHVLLAIGQAGANFGALRYTMDKMRPQFAQILSAVDE